jgi:hypothetical protein
VVGAPLVAHGSDKIATGIVGADETLTAKYLGKDFEEGMDLISFAAGGAALAQAMGRRAITQAAKGTESVIDPVASNTKTWPGGWDAPAKGNFNYAAVRQVEQQAASHAASEAAYEAQPWMRTLHQRLEVTREARQALPYEQWPEAYNKIVNDVLTEFGVLK